MTTGGVEIDLVIDRPGRPLALVEIKSTSTVTEEDVRSLLGFSEEFPDADLFCFSQDERPKRFGRVRAVHWQQGIEEL